MSVRGDDWVKPRSHATHLTREEIEFLRRAWVAGISGRAAARQIQCSSRVANKYYAQFEGREPAKQVRRAVGGGTGLVEHAPRVCVRSGCDCEVARGERVCPRHRDVQPPVGGSDFIRALTPAELMRGRA